MPIKQWFGRPLVVGYVRVSTAQQANEGISLEQQQAAIKAYCKANKLALKETIVDAGHSAYKQPLRRRESGRRVVELLENGEATGVVALRLDRLFRSMRDCINTVMDWHATGITLRLIDFGGQTVDTSTPMGRIMLTLMAAFAEMESYMKAERIRDVWEHRRSQGRRLGSLPPFGYQAAPGGFVVENQDEQATIAYILECRQRGLSLRSICTHLDGTRYKPRGKRWHTTTLQRILSRENT